MASYTPTFILLFLHSNRNVCEHILPIQRSRLAVSHLKFELILYLLKIKHTLGDIIVPHKLAKIRIFPKFKFFFQNANYIFQEKSGKYTFLYLIIILKMFLTVWLRERFTYIISPQSTKMFYSEWCQVL